MIFVYISASGDASKDGGQRGIASIDFARGMITLLFSVGTIVIALILTLAALFQTDEYAKERFTRAKEILNLLIGVFGTIVGFYFGSQTQQTETPAPPSGRDSRGTATRAGGGRPPCHRLRMSRTFCLLRRRRRPVD